MCKLSELTTYLCNFSSVQFPENSKLESFTFHLLFCTPLRDLPVYVLPQPLTTSILSPALLSHRQVPPTSAPRPLGNGDIIKPMEAGWTPPQSLMTHYPVLTHRLTSLPCIQTHSYAHPCTYIPTRIPAPSKEVTQTRGALSNAFQRLVFVMTVSRVSVHG